MRRLHGFEAVVTRYGMMVVPEGPDLIAQSLRLYGEWAQNEISSLMRFIRRGDHVVDVGAFIGTHSRAFARTVGPDGRVFAFEPNPSAFALLDLNARISDPRNIKVRHVGLGAESRRYSLNSGRGKDNLGATSLTFSADDIGEIPVCPLDEILSDMKVDFIKVDVEGMEVDVLRGAERLVRRNSPVMFLEVNFLGKSSGMLPWAVDHDYLCFGVVSRAFNAANVFRETRNIFGAAAECGLLMIAAADVARHANAIRSIGAFPVATIDDLALVLLRKPQYPTEVLAARPLISAAWLR